MHSRARTSVIVFSSLIMVCETSAADSPENVLDAVANQASIFASVSKTFDSNLYRLPDNAQAFGIAPPPGGDRSDEYTQTGVGFDATFNPARQSFAVHSDIRDVKYDRNTYLNHVASQNSANWEWVSSDAVSGELSTAYSRAVADFVNNRIFTKDIIGRMHDLANIRWAIAADFDMRVSVEADKVTHDSLVEKYQDNRKNVGTVTFEYGQSDTDAVALNFREVHARFNDSVLTYTDKSTYLSGSYSLSGITHVKFDGGWYQRTYGDATAADFSGATGRAAIVWSLSALTNTTVTVWRDLGAYVNNESDYYVTDGVSELIDWTPSDTITLGITGLWEHQDYKGSGIGVLSTVRQDRVSSANLSIRWTPRTWLEITLTGGIENRRSTDGYFTYIDGVEGAKFRFIW